MARLAFPWAPPRLRSHGRSVIAMGTIPLFVALVLTGCDSMIPGSDRHSPRGGSEPPPTETDGPATFLEPPQVATVSGSIDLPLPASSSTLTAHSLAGSAQVSERGEFTDLDILDQGAGQLLFLTDENEAVIGVAYVPSTDSGSITVTSESIALGLIKLSPVLWLLSGEREKAVLREAGSHSLFAQLVNNVEAALRDAPDRALDYVRYPAIFEDAMRIAFESLSRVPAGTSSMLRMAAQSSGPSTTIGVEDTPHLADSDGKRITLINPKQVFYGVHIEPLVTEDPIGGGPLEAINDLIRPRGGLGEMTVCTGSVHDPESCPLVPDVGVGGPHTIVVQKPPYTKDVEIGYGVFKITYFQAFGQDEDWKDPTTAAGRATWATVLKLAGVVLHAVGVVPNPVSSAISGAGSLLLSDPIIDSIVADNAEQIANSGLDLGSLREALSKREVPVSALQHLADHLQEEGILDGITRIVYGKTALPALSNARVAMGKLAKVLPAVGQALTAVGIVNESLPFLFDLKHAPSNVAYEIRHRPEVRDRPQIFEEVEIDKLEEPTASVEERVGDHVLELDASESFDEYDLLEDLRFRWDLDNNGEWDGPWSWKHTVESKCDREPYRANLEVRDLDGLVHEKSHTIASEAPVAVLEVDVHKEDDYVTALATNSSDNCTAFSDLQFAWEFDEEFDEHSADDPGIPFARQIARSYPYRGPHRIHLWAKDVSGNIGYAFRDVHRRPSPPDSLVGLRMTGILGGDVVFGPTSAWWLGFPVLYGYVVTGDHTAMVTLWAKNEPDEDEDEDEDRCYNTQITYELSFDNPRHFFGLYDALYAGMARTFDTCFTADADNGDNMTLADTGAWFEQWVCCFSLRN